MNIGLDYDDTYTRDPEMWDTVINFMRKMGHKVHIVTWRYPEEMARVLMALNGKVDGFYPTGRRAKKAFMFKQGICIDVWIDDNPSAILHTMEGINEESDN